MKALFVCTGNICRSPMGELLFPLFFHEPVETESAGVQGLIDSPIDPSSARLLTADGVDSQHFRSRRLTPQIARDSDLILCFTKHQRQRIIALAPRVRSRTFQLADFATICSYCMEHNLIHGDTVEDRLDSILQNASLIQINLSSAQDIEDPFRKEFSAFETAHRQILECFAIIADALNPTQGSHIRQSNG